MAELFQRIRTQVMDFFKSLDRRMKIWLAAGGLFVVLVVVLILWITRPEYVTLSSGIEYDEMAKITSSLDDGQISYQTDENRVMVEIGDLTKARMLIASDATISQPDFSWSDVFADTSFTMTSEVRDAQLMLARANSIAESIEWTEGIDKAKVELYIAPENTFAIEDEAQSSISVVVELTNGKSLDSNKVDAILNLIRTSVPNLPKENISLMSTSGDNYNNLSADADAFAASTQYEQTQTVTNQLNDKLTNFLGKVYGRTHVSVSTFVKLNFDSDASTITTFAPPVEGMTEGLVRSMVKVTESVSNSDTAEGVPGTDTNTEVTDYPAGSDSGNVIQSASETVNFEMNQIVRILEEAQGTIEDITIGVLLDTNVLENNSLTDEQKQDVINLMTSVAGTETRNVTVVAMPFAEDEFGLQKYESGDELIQPGIPLWLLAAIIVVLLLVVAVVILVMRSRSAKAKAEEIAAIQAAEEEKRQSELEEIQTDIEDKSSPKYQIEKFIEAKPEAVAMLLRSWMMEM